MHLRATGLERVRYESRYARYAFSTNHESSRKLDSLMMFDYLIVSLFQIWCPSPPFGFTHGIAKDEVSIDDLFLGFAWILFSLIGSDVGGPSTGQFTFRIWGQGKTYFCIFFGI